MSLFDQIDAIETRNRKSVTDRQTKKPIPKVREYRLKNSLRMYCGLKGHMRDNGTKRVKDTATLHALHETAEPLNENTC